MNYNLFKGFLIAVLLSIVIFSVSFSVNNFNTFLIIGFLNGVTLALPFVFIDLLFLFENMKVPKNVYGIMIFNPIIGMPLGYFITFKVCVYGYLVTLDLLLLANLIIHFKKLTNISFK